MRLDVPFYKQTTSLNCGPVALKMVLAYFGKDEPIKLLEEKTGIEEGKGVSTIQIAIAAASLGYRTDFYSKHVLFNEENLEYKFYQEHGNVDLERSKRLAKNARELGVNIHERSLSLEELLGFVTKDSIPIVLLNWNVVKGKNEKDYQGHFVPIVGYDKQNVYVHNHGLKNTQKFMPIQRETFDEARKSEGTDEDIVIIYRK